MKAKAGRISRDFINWENSSVLDILLWLGSRGFDKVSPDTIPTAHPAIKGSPKEVQPYKIPNIIPIINLKR